MPDDLSRRKTARQAAITRARRLIQGLRTDLDDPFMDWSTIAEPYKQCKLLKSATVTASAGSGERDPDLEALLVELSDLLWAASTEADQEGSTEACNELAHAAATVDNAIRVVQKG